MVLIRLYIVNEFGPKIPDSINTDITKLTNKYKKKIAIIFNKSFLIFNNQFIKKDADAKKILELKTLFNHSKNSVEL